ncbi:MAG: sulfatase-like hydrolase/transferase [Bacteroidales bacterium]|nr:sulfatase-like hydrolase/transferase [Bacteroidales bacterium]
MVSKLFNLFAHRNIVLVAKIYLLAIVMFTFFRLIMFLLGLSFITVSDDFGNVLYAFWMGLRFDLAVTGYIVFCPFWALTLITIINPRSKLPAVIIFYFLFVVFFLSFVVCTIDIPYFEQFFSRLTVTAFRWLESIGILTKMIVQEFSYIGYVMPLLLLTVIFFFGLKKAFSVFTLSQRSVNIRLNIILSLVIGGLMLAGIRGRLEKGSSIAVSDASFGYNSFLNQLGLNPNFTLIQSWLDEVEDNQSVAWLMDDEEALSQIQNFLAIRLQDDCSPVLRRVEPDTVNHSPPNVILVIMESMSAARMTHFGSQNLLTPFLDSIAMAGYFFENIYSAGVHTHNGIFSTLYSFPSLYRERYMNDVTTKYNGMPSALKKCGYNTIFFTTHSAQYNNMRLFLTANDFDQIIEQSDYPSDKTVNAWGVNDDFMFEFAIPVLNERQSPFFATFLTTSNHGPYYVPDYFSPKRQNMKERAVEYSDWSLRKFVQMASRQAWFDNTLFIFTADHGAVVDNIYNMPLNYHHIPLIMYAPKIIQQPAIFDCMGGQIDVFPTTMHLLGLPYVNNTMGIDLFSERRQFIYFSSGHNFSYGVVSDSLFLIVSKDKVSDELFLYRNRDVTNRIDQYQAFADEMKNYAKVNYQTSQYVISNQKQSCE